MVLYGSLNIKTKNMKYIVIFILGPKVSQVKIHKRDLT